MPCSVLSRPTPLPPLFPLPPLRRAAGPSPRAPQTGIEVAGDALAVRVASAMIRAHGWVPVVRGGLDVADELEIAFDGRGKAVRVKSGEAFASPGSGLSGAPSPSGGR